MKYTLCLSGGGFRATLFHLGVIRRLIFLNVFNEIERINSVSGGSIAAAMVMQELTKSSFSSIEDFDHRVIKPVVNFIQKSPRGNIYTIIPLRKDPLKFAKVLDEELFQGLSFNKLAKSPQWVCYATSLNSAYSWKFSQDEIGDSSIGHTQPTQDDRISIGVAASACFPPLFKPLRFETYNRSFQFKYVEGMLVDRNNPTPPQTILLTDGGVYDNLGSESVLTKGNSFIISDASGITGNWRHDLPGLLGELKRPVDIAMDQIGKLRRRLLFNMLIKSDDSILIEAAKPLSAYSTKELPGKESPTRPDNMPVYVSLPRDLEKSIGEIRTDLNAFHDIEIHLLLWNGMVKIDAALKRWVPYLIDKKFWNVVPDINIDFDKALEIMKSGKSVRVWGELHKELHINPQRKFIDHITTVL
ncbi:patatin-like phospholipase family protein [Paenibacillus sp. H1-7]|uniref:patatin-like phospholipase family protein n=1 Tax=Paenibacillus sp. H1-7 TaxID=2282849 RepID=UPI001EF8BD4C|nr:patatin-like phospholipase family protein [Paenibacillus sp. H1-7]ULL13441.1 patatin-like phospholipase family protein [Paenibacillus sp. H1-7]